jgi:DnaJ-class molecular chaperone
MGKDKKTGPHKVTVTCITCHGSGRRGNGTCGLCDGTGKIEVLPPGADDDD